MATGSNDFFLLRDEARDSLPTAACVPAIRRLRQIQGTVLDQAEHDRIGAAGFPRWLLSLTDPAVVADERVAAYLERGAKAGVPNGYLTSVRDVWYEVEQVDPPHLLVTMMSKARLKVVHNQVSAVPSNSMYGIYLEDPTQAEPLCRWLNSDDGQDAFLQKARHYSGGLRKLEPGDLRKVEVPAEFGPSSN